jgi:hypothetical protein
MNDRNTEMYAINKAIQKRIDNGTANTLSYADDKTMLIAYRQQVSFFAEHSEYKMDEISRAISAADRSDKYLKYCYYEKNYLALNKFLLFVAHDLLIEKTPQAVTRGIKAPQSTPETAAAKGSPVTIPELKI